MTEKKTAGLYLTVLTAVLALAGMVAYLVNSGTNYYAKMGVSAPVVICLAVAAVICLARLVLEKKGPSLPGDVLPVCVSVLLAVGLMLLLNVRINNIAAVLTFENSAANMADTTSCFVAIGCCVLSLLVSIVTAFFDMTKKAEAKA